VTIQKFALQMWLVTKLNLFLEQLQNLLWITVIQIALEFQNLWIILEKIQILKKNNEEERQIVFLNLYLHMLFKQLEKCNKTAVQNLGH